MKVKVKPKVEPVETTEEVGDEVVIPPKVAAKQDEDPFYSEPPGVPDEEDDDDGEEEADDEADEKPDKKKDKKRKKRKGGPSAESVKANQSEVEKVKSGKLSVLDFLCSGVQAACGPESIMLMSGKNKKPVEVICSSGIPRLDDFVLGIGGWPRGRLVEVIGPESSGKTTLCLHTLAQAQKAGGQAAFIDAEHAIDLKYASALGVNTEDLMLTQPDDGEHAISVLENLVKAKRFVNDKPMVIVVDSIAALIPKIMLQGEVDDTGAGLGAHARLMSKGLQRLLPFMKGTNVLVLFTNQIRHKIGVRFGNPETTPGGNAMKFYASIRIDIRSIGKDKAPGEGEREIVNGNRVRIKTIKNKIAPPFREMEALMRFGIGIDLVNEKYEALLSKGLITKKGAWITFKGTEEKVCGFKGFTELHNANPKFIDKLLA